MYNNDFYIFSSFESDLKSSGPLTLMKKPTRRNSIDSVSVSVKEEKLNQFNLNEEFPNFKQCPNCLNYVENNEGSRFIICYSFICKGNKYFCWNCNNKLYINDKEKHFHDYGIYSDYCLNYMPKA